MVKEVAILAGGCFWGMQDLIRKLPGVLATRVGYSGGDIPDATYHNHGTHAESIEVIFDPDVLTYRELLVFFFQIHDPTTLNRQGNDRGTSYRSAIFYTSDEQYATALKTIADIEASGLWPGLVTTEVRCAGPFWQAESIHQDYLERFPEGYTCHYPRKQWKLPERNSFDTLPLNWARITAWARHGNLKPAHRVEKEDRVWRERLSDEQYRVMRQHGTEPPHSSSLCRVFEPGRYFCACCDAPLFDAESKFESGTGWPSFSEPSVSGNLAYHIDGSYGMERVEVTCATCDAHLGHVFPDGPPPTGLRYCINAVALKRGGG